MGADELASLDQVEQSAAAEDAEDMLTAAAAVRGLGSKLAFGKVFKNQKVADVLEL